MAPYDGDTIRPSRRHAPPSPVSAAVNPQPSTRVTERQRSSSLSDAPRNDGRVSVPLDLPSFAATRRRSSGGAAAPPAFTSKSSGFGGLGRRNSNRSALTSPPLPSSSQGSDFPTLRTLASYSASNVAAALEPGVELRQADDVWQQVCVRVLPLFNGEGLRGFVEDLNELVLTHVQRTFARCQSSSRLRLQPTSLDFSSLVTGLLAADLTDLMRLGCATLSAKLSPPSPALPLSDERLLSRLNEIWLFFFTGILPHLEGVFWVMRCDQRLRAAAGDTWQERERQGRTGRAEGRIDIRRIALIEFRDQIIHPEIDRLAPLFDMLYNQHPSANRSMPSASPAQSAAMNLPVPPDFRRSRSQPSRRASQPHLAPHPQPQRQYSSPSRLSPDPSYVPPVPSSSNHDSRTPLSSRFSISPTSPYASTPPSAAPSPASSPSAAASPLPPATAQALARRRQMVAVLASLLTDDDRQAEMDELLQLMRPAYSDGKYGRRARSVAGSPAPLDESGEGRDDEPSVSMGLTTSPVMIDEPLELASSCEEGGLLLLPPPHPAAAAAAATAVAPVIADRIAARQRSRTMDSLDEEDVDHGFVHANVNVNGAGLLSSAQNGVGGVGQRPAALSRHSTDGTTPTGSIFGDREGFASGGAGLGEKEREREKEKKKQKRRSFLPRISRSGSQVSNGTSTGGESTEDDSSAIEGGGRVVGTGLAVPSSTSLGGAVVSVSVSGDKLRRGLLRRNSSRKKADLVASMGALGTASGFAVEDDAVE